MADVSLHEDRLMAGLLLGMMCLWAYSAGLVVLHAYQWLRDGAWPSFQMADLYMRFKWPWPTTTWLGAQKILDYLMNTSVAAIAFWLGLACMWAAGSLPKK